MGKMTHVKRIENDEKHSERYILAQYFYYTLFLSETGMYRLSSYYVNSPDLFNLHVRVGLSTFSNMYADSVDAEHQSSRA